MKAKIEKIKSIISMIENGTMKGENLSKIDSLLDSIISLVETSGLEIESKKDLPYREEMKSLDKDLLIQCIKVNESLLKEKKAEIVNQFDTQKYEKKRVIELLSINENVLENLTDFKSEKIEEKLLFSHWNIPTSNYLIDYKTEDKVWDYAFTVNYKNIYDLVSLGLDVPDDFDGNTWSLKEPQKSIFETLYNEPFNKEIFVFFVNRNSVYYLKDIRVVNPKCLETKNIQVIKAMMPKLRIGQMLKAISPEERDEQLLLVSKLFEKRLGEISN
jgi:hypothetical protein